MSRPLVILHGWSDTSDSFRPVARWFKANGFDVNEIYLGDYLSMRDEITLFDFGYALRRALVYARIPQRRHAFDLVLHSTGGLVVREYLRQFCVDDAGRPDPHRTPIRHLLMFAPANFGSPLARLGKSMLGRLFKGWKWDGPFQTGTRILNALELASPLTWSLAEHDLFNPDNPLFEPENTLVTVMTGTAPYGSRLRRMAHENGSDGTVRVSTANLNAHRLSLDFANPVAPVLRGIPRNVPETAFAVFDRDHSSIFKDVKAEREVWRRTVLDALRIESDEYGDHVSRCREISRSVFARGRSRRQIAVRERYHEYMHVVFRVRDQYGDPIDDYFIEFYQEEGDPGDRVFEKVHSRILEKVTVNSTAGAYRSFLFDTTDLSSMLEDDPGLEIRLSVVVAHLSDNIRYRNPPDEPSAGVVVFSAENKEFFHPNEPLLVDVTVFRDPQERVLRLKRLGS